MLEYSLVLWLGACLGSFVNVAALRLPRDKSILWPPSSCPRCKKRIPFYDNVPVLGWLWLRGRCRSCSGKISWRYPAVELFSALLSLALWTRWRADPAWAACAIVAAGLLLAVALADWDTFIIPDELSVGLAALGLLCAPLNPYFAAASWPGAWLASLQGGLIGFALCWGVAEFGDRLFKKESMGGGDIKLLAGVGAWTGGLGAFDTLMLASLIGAVYGVALMSRGRLKRADPIPFGPFLSAAAVFTLFARLPLGFPFV